MIYKGLNRIGIIDDIKTKGGGEIAEVYGGIGESNPIYYKQRDMVGTSPLTFKALGQPLTDYRISGETIQNGTPSPDMPVEVVSVGDRTENLAYGRIKGVNISPQGRIGIERGYDLAIARVEAGKVYTGNTYVFAFYTDEPIIGSVSYDGTRNVTIVGQPSTFTAPITGYVAFRLDSEEQAMLNLGSILLPYEPYGYKIPLTVNGTEYPIYLGQVETTRQIKKLVLTGEEDFSKNYNQRTSYLYYAVKNRILPFLIDKSHLLCNELPVISSTPETQIGINASDVYPVIYFNFGADIMDAQPSGNTVAGLKEYLAAQYAAGTPVTVWYVLAEPETGIVNEPLHKIGDYADTISMAQAGVTIQTTAGTNTLTVGTTVQPSSVSVTGHIKPVTT